MRFEALCNYVHVHIRSTYDNDKKFYMESQEIVLFFYFIFCHQHCLYPPYSRKGTPNFCEVEKTPVGLKFSTFYHVYSAYLYYSQYLAHTATFIKRPFLILSEITRNLCLVIPTIRLLNILHSFWPSNADPHTLMCGYQWQR